MSQVDSIRFLNYNDCNENVKLYIDDVKFGVWSEKTSEPAPNPPAENPEDKGGCSWFRRDRRGNGAAWHGGGRHVGRHSFQKTQKREK